jgi:hypothetical protein
MRRPIGVTIIASLFLLAGVYICSIGAVVLLAHGTVVTLRAFPFVRALAHVSPYWTLLVGAVWAAVAWGLLRLRDWARFTATIMLGIGIASGAVAISTRMHFGWRALAECLEIALRGAAIWYLLLPSVLDTFLAKPSGENSFKSSPR